LFLSLAAGWLSAVMHEIAASVHVVIYDHKHGLWVNQRITCQTCSTYLIQTLAAQAATNNSPEAHT
jgi:hypothetical protein